ncbi:MAG: 30S ribosomal protein S27e [Candidatus Altiarchaeales archaeon ex4484_96]|nr:MAG: 30S ribosomal protein S27e [Candidatus Altiarchaeales archaeon ex4484_96]
MSESRFLRIKCTDCGNEQVIFERASTVIRCLVCDKILAEPKGCIADIKAEKLDVVDK